MKPISSKQLRYSRERAEANKVAAIAQALVKADNKCQSTRGNSQDHTKDAFSENLKMPPVKRAESQGG